MSTFRAPFPNSEAYTLCANSISEYLHDMKMNQTSDKNAIKLLNEKIDILSANIQQTSEVLNKIQLQLEQMTKKFEEKCIDPMNKIT